MKVLKIKAKTLQDALLEARRQLGEGAMPLHTKQYEEVSMLGLRRSPVVEILAAVDTTHPASESASQAYPEGSAGMQDIAGQIAGIRNIIAQLDTDTRPQELTEAADRLIKNGVSEMLTRTLLSGGASETPDQIMAAIGKRLNCAGGIKQDGAQARVVLVGPTGAGKTTTAAKLAAEYVLVHKKNVALMTLDTYRVGAVEQLATYARILDIPLEVGMCPEDVDALVARHRDKDLIIIDTVGRSQREKRHLDELDRLVKPARPTESHLVISSQASVAAQREAVDAFRSIGVNRLIITKLDECPVPGCLLDLAAHSLLPFSYLTYGQEVPDDICVADRGFLSQLIWEGSL